MQNKKRIYYKNHINNIAESHNYHLLNITLNLGEIIENLLKQEYEEHEFNYVFEYIKIYDTYLKQFINNMTIYISEKEIQISQKLKNIYNGFLKAFYKDISPHVNEEYIKELRQNYTKCLNLNETINKDEINYDLNLEHINYNRNDSNINLNQIEEILFLNNCYTNNFYNYSVKIYKNFETEYKEELDKIINKIIKIDTSDLETALLYKYFEQNFILKYNQSNEVFLDLNYNFLSYDDIVSYLNYTQNNIYFDYLYALLLNSFNSSYTNYFNNYLAVPLIDNITIFINKYAEILLDYLINKINNEFNYYTMILKNTEELGENSKLSLSNLYINAKKKIYESFTYTINEYILFYIDVFYRKNKYIFSNNYINFFTNGLNEYNLEIYHLNEIIDTIIYDEKFNKTLNEYSKDILNNLIISKLNNTIQELLNNKLSTIYLKIDDLKLKIDDVLYNININEENKNINNIIKDYQIILSNQNNQFTFKVSSIPFDELYLFLKDVLEPQILKIKEDYNLIEEQLLGEIISVTDTFPDFKQIIKEKLEIENSLEFIKSIYEETKDLLLKYQDDLNDVI